MPLDTIIILIMLIPVSICGIREGIRSGMLKETVEYCRESLRWRS